MEGPPPKRRGRRAGNAPADKNFGNNNSHSDNKSPAETQEPVSVCPAEMSPAWQSAIGRHSRRQFSPTDAPPAAYCRKLRRTWAAIANEKYRHTGSVEQALRAAAGVLLADIELAGPTARRDNWKNGGRNDMPRPNIVTPIMRARLGSRDAENKAIDAILADATAAAILAGDV